MVTLHHLETPEYTPLWRIMLGETARLWLEDNDIDVRFSDDEERYYLTLKELTDCAGLLRSLELSERDERLLDRVSEEIEWSRSQHRGGNHRVAFSPYGRTIQLDVPYILTLAEKLNVDLSDQYFAHYSPKTQSWSLDCAEQDFEYLKPIFAEYEVTLSPRLNRMMDGTNDVEKTLNGYIRELERLGVSIPNKFPSGRVLEEHQIGGIAGLAVNNGGLLGDEVGLGKGGEFIVGWMTYKKKMLSLDPDAYIGPCVVNTVNNLIPEIVQEIQKWDKDAVIEIVTGTKRYDIDPKANYIVLHHGLMRNRVLDVINAEPSGFISDEAHAYKNESAKQTQKAQELAEWMRDNIDDPYIVMATGTPFLNSPTELWSLLKILDWDTDISKYAMSKMSPTTTYWFRDRRTHRMRSKKSPVSPQRAFEIRWCDGKYDKYRTWTTGASNTSELHRLLVKKGMIRRKKSDVIHPLPEIYENTVHIKFTKDERAIYDEAEQDFQNFLVDEVRRIAEEEGKSIKHAIAIAKMKLNRAEAIMRMSKLFTLSGAFKVRPAVEWIKAFMDGTLEVKHADGHTGPVSDDPTRRKLIVFVHHRDPLFQLVEHEELQKYGLVHILSQADQTPEEIQEHKRRFQEDDDVRLMICSFAAKAGHTLTAAKDELILEIPYTPGDITQMVGRIWARFSEQFRPHEAFISYMVGEDTRDGYMLNRVLKKKSMFDAIIDGEDYVDVEENEEQDLNELFDDSISDLILGLGDISLVR